MASYLAGKPSAMGYFNLGNGTACNPNKMAANIAIYGLIK